MFEHTFAEILTYRTINSVKKIPENDKGALWALSVPYDIVCVCVRECECKTERTCCRAKESCFLQLKYGILFRALMCKYPLNTQPNRQPDSFTHCQTFQHGLFPLGPPSPPVILTCYNNNKVKYSNLHIKMLCLPVFFVQMRKTQLF